MSSSASPSAFLPFSRCFSLECGRVCETDAFPDSLVAPKKVSKRKKPNRCYQENTINKFLCVRPRRKTKQPSKIQKLGPPKNISNNNNKNKRYLVTGENTSLTFGNSRVCLETGVWRQASIFSSLFNQERFRHFSAVWSTDNTDISFYCEIHHSPGKKRAIRANTTAS